MRHGALPALSTGRRITAALCAALAIGLGACSEQDGGEAGALTGATLFSSNPGGGGKNSPSRVTGGGRIDFPPGNNVKNKKPSQDFHQTFGFHIQDKDSDGVPDEGANLEFTDHRKAARIGNSPRRLKAVAFTSFTPDNNPDCPEGSAIITGIADLMNTPGNDSFEFELRVCDKDEPGNKFPNDWFDFSVPELGPDPHTGEPYRMHNHSFPPEVEGAYLTGGNIQIRLSA